MPVSVRCERWRSGTVLAHHFDLGGYEYQRDFDPGSNWTRVFASSRVPQANAERVAHIHPTRALITVSLSYSPTADRETAESHSGIGYAAGNCACHQDERRLEVLKEVREKKIIHGRLDETI
jgi:hypothetical protein